MLSPMGLRTRNPPPSLICREVSIRATLRASDIFKKAIKRSPSYNMSQTQSQRFCLSFAKSILQGCLIQSPDPACNTSLSWHCNIGLPSVGGPRSLCTWNLEKASQLTHKVHFISVKRYIEKVCIASVNSKACFQSCRYTFPRLNKRTLFERLDTIFQNCPVQSLRVGGHAIWVREKPCQVILTRLMFCCCCCCSCCLAAEIHCNPSSLT